MKHASFFSIFVAMFVIACGTPPAMPAPDGGLGDGAVLPPGLRDERIEDRAVVAFLGHDALGPWWLEERIEGQPIYVGDHDLGPRSVVRATPERHVVWTAPAGERLVDATLHASGEWSGVGVDATFGLFLVRGDSHGLLDRITLDDPELTTDERAWGVGARTPPDALRVQSASEASPSIAADGEDVVIALQTAQLAVITYRWHREDGAFVRGPRTLVGPATPFSPFLPIGGSYDDFDAVVVPYLLQLGVDAEGRAFLALMVDRGRLRLQNETFGTDLELLRDVLYPRENTIDALVLGVDRDGTFAFATVVGTPDVEDEVFGLAVGEERIAVLGRSRRELGRENSELHVMVAELDHDGAALGTTTFDAALCGLAETGLYVGDDLFVGGAEGWTQNPSGRSVLTPGHPFLLRMSGASTRTVERLDALVPTTSGAAELRALMQVDDRILLGGQEHGPVTHTGDDHRELIRSDAFWVERAMPAMP